MVWHQRALFWATISHQLVKRYTREKNVGKRLLVGGWANPTEKYEFVSWDDDIPNWMESHKIHIPTQIILNMFGRMEVEGIKLEK